MAQTTRNLGLPLLAAAQAQKHVTHNEALDRLDALVQIGVRGRVANAPPSDAADEDRYIVGPSPTGAWTGLAGHLVLRRGGAWESFAPQPGWIAYVADEALFVGWNGAAWTDLREPAAGLLAKLLSVDGDGSGLDADRLGGVDHASLATLAAARGAITGGGLLSVSQADEVRWGADLVVAGLGRGNHWSTQGRFEIAIPPVGTPVSGLGGAADRSVTAGGVPLIAGEALYYRLPVGGAASSRADAFFVVGAGTDFALPPTWLRLCTRAVGFVFWNGLRLAAGQSYDLSVSTAARPRVSGLGIGTDSDAANALAVASPAILFNHAGAGVQAKLNKAAPGETASLMFQTGFSGRAEFGLVGSDRFSLKVSADGAGFAQAFSVDPETGRIAFDSGVLREEVAILTASGTWTKPAWARSVTILCLGGGGGGGSGRRGAAGSVRAGGGGGGAGAHVAESYPAADLPAELTATVGAGGTGGAARTSDGADGQSGANGGATSVSGDGAVLLSAAGGGGGGGGATAAGTAGLPGQNRSLSPVGAGGAGSVGAVGGTGGEGVRGAGGGGGGGGLSAANAAASGGTSGPGYAMGGTQRAASGVPGGGIGLGGFSGTVKAWARGAGSGGGGGGAGPANASGSGGAGASGGLPSGGGGGGGASANGAPSGAGGDGARGEVWIVCRG